MKKKNDVPTYDVMMKPLLQALKELGGSGTVDEIANKVAQIMNLRNGSKYFKKLTMRST